MKKYLLALIFLLVLIALPLAVYLTKNNQDIRQRATSANNLYFEPASKTMNISDTVTLPIKIDTGQNRITSVQLAISFDSAHLEAISITGGDFLSNVYTRGLVGNGTASITVGTPPNQPKQGTGTIAQLTFKALQKTTIPTAVEIASTTQVTAFNEQNVDLVFGKQPARITILAGGSGSVLNEKVLAATDASGSATLEITQPVSGTTLTTNHPTIQGVSPASALIVVSIDTTPIISATTNATTTGAWTYTPNQSLTDGDYTVTVTADDNLSATPQTATASFTIASTSIGGTDIVASDSSIPVTGSVYPTVIVLTLAILFLLFGIKAAF